jgi:hypothetical protein
VEGSIGEIVEAERPEALKPKIVNRVSPVTAAMSISLLDCYLRRDSLGE